MSRIDSTSSEDQVDINASDFNGDGILDLVVVSHSLNMISVLPNRSSIGSLSLLPKLSFPVGRGPTSLAIADLDGDGQQDIVVTNSTDNSISVLRNTSSINAISFSPKIDITTGAAPAFVSIGDLDGDGKPDIVCTNSGGNSISVFKNSSSQNVLSFAPKVDFATGQSPWGLVVADFDGDGFGDVATSNQMDNTVSLFRNTSSAGLISFDSKKDVPVPITNASFISSADLNGDGKIDLAGATNVNGAYYILTNKSTNGVLSFPDPLYSSNFFESSELRIGDVDGDGKPDLVSTSRAEGRVSVLKNLTQADSIYFDKAVYYQADQAPVSAAIADLDGDGLPDLISANTSIDISIFRNFTAAPFITSFTPVIGGNGASVMITGLNLSTTQAVSFGGVPATAFQIISPTAIAAIVGPGTSGAVKVQSMYGSISLAGFTFNKAPTITSYSPSAGSIGATLAIVGTGFEGVTSVSIGGIAAASFQVQSPTLITATVGNVAIGNLDIIVTNSFGADTVAGYYTGTTVQSFFPESGPAGTVVTIRGTHFSHSPAGNSVYFGAARAIVSASSDSVITAIVPVGASYQPISVTANQFTAYSSKPFGLSFKSTPDEFTDSSFMEKMDSATTDYLMPYVSLGDFNGDGKTDVIIIGVFTSPISIFKNTSTAGQFSFSGSIHYSVPTSPYKACAADFDGDGKMDFATVNTWATGDYVPSVSVFINTGSANNIEFGQRIDLPLPSLYEGDFQDIVTTDFNGDGKPDIAINSFGGYAILQNTSVNGIISFSEPLTLPVDYGGGRAAIADFDGDGKPDLITGGETGSIVIFRNVSSNGKIAFDKGFSIPSGSGPRSISVGDLDGDGKMDVAVICGGNDALIVHRNTSTAAQFSFDPGKYYQLDQNPGSVSINDLNGDGKPDLSITMNSKNVAVLKNLSTPGNLLFSNIIEYPENANPMDVTAVDIDGDGKVDIVTANPNGHDFTVFSNQVKDDGLPNALITGSGPTEFCEGDSVLLKTSGVVNASYQWFRDGITIPSANDSVYIVNQLGIFSVQVNAGGSVSTSPPLQVIVKPVPRKPVITTSNDSLCPGNFLVLHSSVPGNDEWYRNDIRIAGSADSFYTVTSPGNYKVMTRVAGCPSSFSDSITIQQVSPPDATITAAKTIFCDGDSVLLSSSAGPGFSYQWKVNDENIPNATSSTMESKIPGLFDVVISSSGCSTLSDSVLLTRNGSLFKPVITKNGAQLISSVDFGNQWYLNGAIITGATFQTYTPSQNGNYSVQAESNGCLSAMSDGYAYVITGVITIDNTHFIRLGPNPANTVLILNFNLINTPSLNADIFDISGKKINTLNNLRNGNLINISGLPGAIYIVKIYSASGRASYAFKILKQ